MKNRYHQVVIRKDGPVHAIEYANGDYYSRAACGIYVNVLAQIKRRLFPPAEGACRRCLVSVGKNQ